MPEHGIEILAATESHKPVFQNLIQLYLYDMAAQSSFPVNEQGLYDYDFLNRFWEHPYLFLQDGEIAGFCMVIQNCPIRERGPCWFMAEFCVLRPYQRTGVGRSAAMMVLEKHIGDWEISWDCNNLSAQAFWPTVLPDAQKNTRRVTFDGAEWVSVAFHAKQPSTD